MHYNFDTYIERTGTESSKWDHQTGPFGAEGLLPFWVADADFAVLPQIREAMIKRIDHPVFGYTAASENYFKTLLSWMKKHYGYTAQKEWIVPATGVMGSVSAAVQALTDEGDSIVIQTPVYPPFHSVVTTNNRQLLKSELICENGFYTMDYADLESKFAAGAKMMILCNPHNPVGRVWTKEEMQKLIDLCNQYHIYLVSDEIHCDIIMPGHKHCSAMLFDSIHDRLVVCTAPSKTFNIAGLSVSNAVIPNEDVRKKISTCMTKNKASSPNILAKVACEAAYTYGENWMNEMNEYVDGNIQHVCDFCKENMSDVVVTRSEGTYLIWMDFSCLGKKSSELNRFFVDHAKLAMGEGTPYSDIAGDHGFMRLNVGCPRSTLDKGLNALLAAYRELKK